MTKKNLIILIIVIIVVLLAGFVAYQYSTEGYPFNFNKVENSIGGAQTEGGGNGGGLSICFDQCGNGACQPADPSCEDSLNCVCPETPQDCPQDCK